MTEVKVSFRAYIELVHMIQTKLLLFSDCTGG